ncbi:MAG: molybdate ABC transporter substrate-binding protein [Bryobacterales bacterium]|nr:molybdate ABC transporter substrate-binding protein [Bryobacterales bacterium]
MNRIRPAAAGCCIAALASVSILSCARTPAPAKHTLTIAAAANLTGAMDELARAFERQSGVRPVVSYGSTAQLAQQIDNGAPFDVFAAADTAHIDQLIGAGKLRRESRAVYARGQLALWVPDGNLRIGGIEDLGHPEVRVIAVAQPTLAPYGLAAVEALKASRTWDKVQSKIVYANNINVARHYAASGNANAAFTAFSLVMKAQGAVIKIDPALYRPIEQALAVTTDSANVELAEQFRKFVLSRQGRSILASNGYGVP